MIKPKTKPKHRLRQVDDQQSVEAIARDDWLDPFGAKHTDGKVYRDSRLPRIGTPRMQPLR